MNCGSKNLFNDKNLNKLKRHNNVLGGKSNTINVYRTIISVILRFVTAPFNIITLTNTK